MNFNYLLSCVAASLLLSSCRQVTSKEILKKIEQGTDSTIWRIKDDDECLVKTVTFYFNGEMTTFVEYDSSKKHYPRRIYSNLMGNIYGHDFYFDSDGELIEYSYNIGQQDFASYIRHYDSVRRMSEQGTILVDIMKDKKYGINKFFFTSVFHEHIKVEISSDKRSEERLSLKASALQPMLLEGYIKASDDSVFFIRIEGFDEDRKNTSVYFDTVKFANW